MTFLAPLFLLASAAVALGVVALHFLARSQPPRAFFPTARFVPESRERAPSRSITPNDLLLLALRVLAVVLLGLAFARPTLTAARASLIRVVVLDRSRAVASSREATDSARAWLRPGDRLVAFDTAARSATPSALDSADDGPARPRGSLSAALVRATRDAGTLRDAADSIELVIVSPLVGEEWDAATASIRATWPGGLRLVRVAASSVVAERRTMSLRAAPADPLRATLALMGAGADVAGAARERVRIVRDETLRGADSAWARTGGVVVHWRAAPIRADRSDTLGAVVADGVVLVASLERSGGQPGGTAVARWVDGAPAAAERPLGDGCVRDVAVRLDRPGDLVLRPALRRLVSALAAPCGGARDFSALDALRVAQLAGNARPAAVSALAPAPEAGRALVPWLIGLALLCLIVEQWWRRRRTDA